MEEIDEPVSDAHEIFGSPLLDELLQVTHIVVYEDVWLHIAQGHNILQEFCLVSVTVRVDFSMDVATPVDVEDALDMGGEVLSGVKTTVALPSLMLTEPLTRNEVMAIERMGTLGQCLNTRKAAVHTDDL